jgi:excinuclease ABC subunit C
MPATVCLNYHLHQCPGPCVRAVDEAGYRQTVDRLLLFLSGRKLDVLTRIAEEMAQAAAKLDFERALILRAQLESLSLVPQRRMRFRVHDQLASVQNTLRLARRPSRVEGYDISNISGTEAVGSLVYFREGMPYKANYRRFKIKTVPGIDDYAMISEVLTRRFSGTLASELELPDLIMIDGGRGHLQAAEDVLRRLKIPLPVVSIAKRFEHLYVQWQPTPLSLSRNDEGLQLLMRVRDEAHRFALGYHRLLRKRSMLASELDQIPGIGPKRKLQLLRILADSAPRGLSVEYLTERGIDERTATAVIEHWKRY